MYPRLVRRAIPLLTLSACGSSPRPGHATIVEIPSASHRAPQPSSSAAPDGASAEQRPEGWWTTSLRTGLEPLEVAFRFEPERLVLATRKAGSWRLADVMSIRWEPGAAGRIAASSASVRFALERRAGGWQLFDLHHETDELLQRPSSARAQELAHLDVPSASEVRALCAAAADCCGRLGPSAPPACARGFETFGACRQAIEVARYTFSAMPPESCEVPRRWGRDE
jgi:hypothetical protein